ncbi:hypothetical protein [Nocardiopsis sp. NPDC055824]
MPHSIQQPVRDDGSPILGPSGRPLYLPHTQIPGWAVFNEEVDASALGLLAFLYLFVDQAKGELSSSITTADICKRFGVQPDTVMRATARARSPLGLIPRLAQAHALTVGPNSVKTRDCEQCQTVRDEPCPPSCTSRKGRIRRAPRFELAYDPPGGFAYPGPLSRWEWHNPKRLAKRLRDEGPDSTLPPQNRMEVLPFVQVISWPILDRTIGLIELGVYVFLAAHTSLADGAMSTGEDLYRNAIGRRFGWSDNHVSKITKTLEDRKLIAKNGLVQGSEHRFGHTSEPTSYVVRVMPPAGLMHPGPLGAGEQRDADLITQRQEAVRSVPEASLRFPRVPSDLRIVGNSGFPQEGTRANEGLWTGKSEAVDGEIGDLNTHPTTHPQTHPSPSAQQPQPQGGVPHPRGAATDGEEFSQGGSRSGAEPPAAAPAVPDPVLVLVERYVPSGMCLKGQDDQRSLVRRLRTLLEAGHLSEGELGDVFDGLEQVVKPFPVVANRLSSVSRLTAHLEVVRRRRAEEAAAVASSTRVPGEGHCLEHNLACMPELYLKYNAPMCVECEKALQGKPRAAVGQGGTDGENQGWSEEEVAEKFRQSLDNARTGARSPRREQQPAAAPGPLEAFLKAMEPQPEPAYCGSCNQEFRTITVQVSATHVERRRCPRCHWSVAKAG